MIETLIKKKKKYKENILLEKPSFLNSRGSSDFCLFVPAQASDKTWSKPTFFSF